MPEWGAAAAGDGSPAAAALAAVMREESGRILAALIRTTGDFDLAEDALQDAVEAALRRWPVGGVPPAPGAWLTVTARRRAIDRLRRDQRFARKLETLAALLAEQEHDAPGSDHAPAEPPPPIADERLRLIFTCAHPALAPEARVALTLRTLCGLTTAEIARAFLVSERTMAQRLVRAKRKIREARIPYRVPQPAQWPERVEAVLAVVYLIYNEGYVASAGDTVDRPDLAEEAIRLGRLLAALLPGEAEAHALLALMLLQQARRPARVGAAGELVTLEAQDRTRWDAARIAEGQGYLDRGLALGPPGPYQVQAAIAALHDAAPTAADTDWPQIALLYGTLARMQPGPMVALNRAAALGMAAGPQAGLRALDAAGAAYRELAVHHLYHAARADLLRRAGRMEDAARAYEAALALVANGQERRYLRGRLVEMRGPR